MNFTDIFGIKHKNSQVIDTTNQFKRVFVIQDSNGVRYTCLKPNAPKNLNRYTHFKQQDPKCAPKNYLTPYFDGSR